MIDNSRYRSNIGIVLVNYDKKVFWAKRIGSVDNWQFPQGGICHHESLEDAMYRELKEEIGLNASHVKILAINKEWLYYRFPASYVRNDLYEQRYLGQCQRWFLLEFIADDSSISLDHTADPEFIDWSWVDYWHPIYNIIYFKYHIYSIVLHEFSKLIFKNLSHI